MGIKEIIIINSSKGLCNMNEITTESLELSNKGEIKHNYYNHFGDRIVKTYVYSISQKEMEVFFKKVSENIKIHQWGNDYTSPIICGHQWNCHILYEDNTEKFVKGNIDYPPKAREFINEIMALTSYKDDPWIF